MSKNINIHAGGFYKNKSDKVPIIVHIKKIETGEIAIIEESSYLDNGLIFVFMWEEGNFSCDCNRELFFNRVFGLPDNFDDVECSDGRFLVNIYDKNNILLYSEF